MRRGQVRGHRFANGLRVHSVDARELCNARSSLTLFPSLNLCVLLTGELAFSLGGTRYRFRASEHAPCFFFMNILAPSQWRREMQSGQHVRKVVVTLPADWMASWRQGTDLPELLNTQHNLVDSWEASTEQAGFTRDILENIQRRGLQAELELEVAALNFVALSLRLIEARFGSAKDIENIQGLPENKRSLRSAKRSGKNRKARKIREYLEQYVIAEPGKPRCDMAVLAKQLGMSNSTLQRNFKQAYELSISGYVRERKLELAREALLRDNLSIGEVAWLAGYNHYSNFLKAFKNQFGMSPGAWQVRMAE